MNSIIYTAERSKFRMKEYVALAKPRLASSVVFSSAAGYLLGTPAFNILEFVFLLIGGFLVVGSSNAFNQVWEKDRDALMDRTKIRPIPSGLLSSRQSAFAATLMGVVGVVLLYFINPFSAFFGTLSLLIYVLVYTPLKAKGPWAVFVGAIPGAIPFMLGWVAARNDFDIESGTLFAIQFVWQVPHFWAIAWMLHDDYAKASYNLLPSGKRDHASAFQALLYTFALIPISILPVTGLTKTLSLSIPAALLIGGLGIFLLIRAIALFRNQTVRDAKRLMLASVLWLTLIQIIYVVDRYI